MSSMPYYRHFASSSKQNELAIIENAYEKGIEQLELEVVASNQSGLALYKKMGFETWGTFPNKMKYKDGTYADCYWMIKKL